MTDTIAATLFGTARPAAQAPAGGPRAAGPGGGGSGPAEAIHSIARPGPNPAGRFAPGLQSPRGGRPRGPDGDLAPVVEIQLSPDAFVSILTEPGTLAKLGDRPASLAPLAAGTPLAAYARAAALHHDSLGRGAVIDATV